MRSVKRQILRQKSFLYIHNCKIWNNRQKQAKTAWLWNYACNARAYHNEAMVHMVQPLKRCGSAGFGFGHNQRNGMCFSVIISYIFDIPGINDLSSVKNGLAQSRPRVPCIWTESDKQNVLHDEFRALKERKQWNHIWRFREGETAKKRREQDQELEKGNINQIADTVFGLVKLLLLSISVTRNQSHSVLIMSELHIRL